MVKTLGIIGAGGFGRELKALVEQQLQRAGDTHQVVFVDDHPAVLGQAINGTDVIGYQEFLDRGDIAACVSFADPVRRRDVCQGLDESGVEYFDIRAPTAVTQEQVNIGAGSILCEYSILTSNIKIGRQFHCNLYSYVAHDCVVGDFVTLAPRVSLNGRVFVEDFVFVGTGAVFMPGTVDEPLIIGQGATIGMGAVVTKSVRVGATVMGNPAAERRRA